MLFEGAQATLLDLDHGTYPFVTSSNPIASGAATGIGIGPTRIDRVLGVAKAYVTRVGEGPFPSEIEGPDQERLQRARRRVRHGHRPRAPLRLARPRRAPLRRPRERHHLARADEARRPLGLRRAPGLRRATACATARETPHFPAHQSDFHHAEPVWEVLPGWEEPLDHADTRDELPEAARRYVEFVERELEVPVELVGVGAARERVLA